MRKDLSFSLHKTPTVHFNESNYIHFATNSAMKTNDLQSDFLILDQQYIKMEKQAKNQKRYSIEIIFSL